MSTFSADSAVAARVVPSPNHDERRAPIDLIILHYTGMANGEVALSRLCDPASKVSCHYFVFEDGAVCQLVPEQRRAWHAGVSSWQGDTDINSRSIGVELVNPGHELGYADFPEAQIDAVVRLCRDIAARNAIPTAGILAHSDIAPARKNDPGEKFPWARLNAAGVGLWVTPTAIHAGPELDPGDRSEVVAKLQRALGEFGYGLGVTGVYDAETTAAVTAFQRHFRPARIDGIADHSTTDTLRRLIATLGRLLARC